MISNVFDSIYQFRGLIYSIVVRDLRSRYIGSVLGMVWLLLPPIVMVLIYTVVFSTIMRARLPELHNQYAYSIYLCAGIIVWTFTLELVQRGKGVFLENANLIKKSSFPRMVLFVPVVLVALFNSFVLLMLVLIFMLIADFPLSVTILGFIPALAAGLYLGLTVGVLASILNVFFRDTGQIVDIFSQGLFWATPIVYPVTILPERIQALMYFNPVFSVIRVAQNSLLGMPVDLIGLVPAVVFATFVLVAAFLLYKRSYADLLDQI